jgi:hypothetical protein
METQVDAKMRLCPCFVRESSLNTLREYRLLRARGASGLCLRLTPLMPLPEHFPLNATHLLLAEKVRVPPMHGLGFVPGHFH